MSKKWFLISFGLVILSLGVIGFKAHNDKVQADAICASRTVYAFGRPQYCGYYKNNYDTSGGFVLSNGITSNGIDDFVSTIKGHLGNSRNGAGASFIIQTMLGRPVGSAMITSTANSSVAEWEALVRSYRDPNGDGNLTDTRINFNYSYSWTCGQINTFWQDSQNDIAPHQELSGSSSSTPCGPSATVNSIVFFGPGGNTASNILYVIKKNCGNPIGRVNPLPPVDSPPTGEITSWNCNEIKGKATDPDWSDTIAVRLYKDGTHISTVSTNSQDAFMFPIAQDQDYRPHAFEVYAVNKTPSGANDTGTLVKLGSTMRPGVCSTITCGTNVTTNPAQPENNEDFSLTVDYELEIGTRGATSSYTVNFNIPPPVINGVQPAYDYVPNRPIPPGGRAGTATTLKNLRAPTGSYSGTYTITIQSVSRTCTLGEPVLVYNLPYFRAYGGDVRAGDNFSTGTTCNPATSGDIKAFNRGASGSYAGAGSQIGVFARGTIQDFVSAALRASIPTPPDDLTFANTGGTTYGGNFGSGACIPDYFAGASSGTVINGPINIGTLVSGTYHVTSPGTLNIISGSITNGRRITIYADYDVVINGTGITFSGSYTNPSDIPSLYIITRANIYVNNTVNQLDGGYVAQNGKIFTCSNGTAIPGVAWIAQNCGGSRLTVNGALVANQIKLLRVIDSLKDSTFPEPAASSRAAEILNFTPEIWLTLPIGGSNNASLGIYDSIVSLPPVL